MPLISEEKEKLRLEHAAARSVSRDRDQFVLSKVNKRSVHPINTDTFLFNLGDWLFRKLINLINPDYFEMYLSRAGLKTELLESYEQYAPDKFETHTEQGFSGGPLMQNSKVVAIAVSGSGLEEALIWGPWIKRASAIQLVVSSVMYIGGGFISNDSLRSWVQFLAPCVNFLPPITNFVPIAVGSVLAYCFLPLEKASLAGMLFGVCVGVTNYAFDGFCSLKNRRDYFLRMTPELLDWMRLKLNGAAEESAAART